MKDNRTALKNGTMIVFSDEKKVNIHEEVGRGAGCIVYDADYQDSMGVSHLVRVKEFFPCYLPVTRDSSLALIPSDSHKEKFESSKKSFMESYTKNTDISRTFGLINSTVISSDIVFHNNTIYTLMIYNEGTDYSKYKDNSLKEMFTHIRSLAKLIQKYHQNGYLHLDIKPENVLIIPETPEHILLFDFDSVISFDQLSQKGKFRWSYSDGFSAPEQVQGKIQKIGMHTDIYSIGAMVFYKLFGRKPSEEDGRISSVYRFDDMQFSGEKYQPGLYRVLQNFLSKTLCISVKPRCNDMQPVIEQLDELIRLSDTEGIYLIDSFQYNPACFVGRQTELKEIHNVLDRNQIVFLSGIGGIGKTELAKQYAHIYRNEYNKVIFAVFEKDIETLVCDEIMLNNISRDEKESSGDYFKRKIDILRTAVSPDDLIIIDNFDIDSDDNLETLFNCQCKFIITTRMNFRDFNYEQINIGCIKDEDEILNLFCHYNDTDYSDIESDAVCKLVSFVEHHTMTVELISKYLRVSQELPSYLYQRFHEKEGTGAAYEVSVKQRKDRKLRSETVNNHLRILFDISGFSDTEKEILRSLSLFAGIRINRQLFVSICMAEEVESRLEHLIKNGWIEYNDLSDKVSLHQVIQDLVYSDLKPDEINCANTVEGMKKYVSSPSANHNESDLKQKVFGIFMDRLSGNTLSYARLCLLYSEENNLDEAEKICKSCDDPEAFDILQRIYRKRLQQTDDVLDTTEEDFDNHAVCQLTLIKEIIDNIMLYCQKYSEAPEYIAKEFILTGFEVAELLQDKAWFALDPIPELNKLYDKIIELFDTAAENLAVASYPPSEKKMLYKKLLDFYSGQDFTMITDIFYDPDKSYKYLQIINELNKSTNGEIADIKIIEGDKRNFFDSSVNLWYIADKFEEEKEYEKAINFHKAAYKEGEESYASSEWSIAKIYLKKGDKDTAISILKKILDNDRKYIGKDLSKYYLYTEHACIDLTELLIDRKDYSEAQRYAKELIHYKLPDTQKNNDSYAVKYVLAGCFFLYRLEQNSIEKNSLWQECLKYFKMLDNKKIEDEILDFVAEYIDKEEFLYKQLIKVIDRIDKDSKKDTREHIIKRIIEKHLGETGFEKYHIIFLLKLAEPSCNSPHENIINAVQYCDDAQELYDRYGIEDAYIQNRIFDMKVELLIHTENCDYEELKRLRNLCDYKLLAEHKIAENQYSKEEQIKVWRNATDNYNWSDNSDMKIVCLKEGLNILKPILNQYEFSQADGDYYFMMSELIQSYIYNIKKYDLASQNIYKLYYDLTKFYFDKLDFKLWDYTWKLKDLARYLAECFRFSECIRMYLAALYVGIKSEISTDVLSFSENTEQDVIKLCEIICDLPECQLEPIIIDSVIDCKDKLIEYKEYAGFAGNLYERMISRISEEFQYKELEFKEKQ